MELFVQRMDQVQEQIEDVGFDAITKRKIMGFFLSQIEMNVLLDIGAIFISSCEEVRTGLKEKFGGARRSIPRTVLKCLQVSRKPRRSPGSCTKVQRITAFWKSVTFPYMLYELICFMSYIVTGRSGRGTTSGVREQTVKPCQNAILCN